MKHIAYFLIKILFFLSLSNFSYGSSSEGEKKTALDKKYHEQKKAKRLEKKNERALANRQASCLHRQIKVIPPPYSRRYDDEVYMCSDCGKGGLKEEYDKRRRVNRLNRQASCLHRQIKVIPPPYSRRYDDEVYRCSDCGKSGLKEEYHERSSQESKKQGSGGGAV